MCTLHTNVGLFTCSETVPSCRTSEPALLQCMFNYGYISVPFPDRLFRLIYVGKSIIIRNVAINFISIRIENLH
jgi:hypothetical protein